MTKRLYAKEKRVSPEAVFSESVFWSRATLNEQTGCFEWIRGDGSKTYGNIKKDGKAISAHRVAYELTVGDIPKGLFICHTCDNKLCVNPTHLYAGTNKDNQLDAVERGQHWFVNPQAAKTGCPLGHPYDGTNNRGDRVCITCSRRRCREYSLRRKLEVCHS